jgi:parallel beta-helix repeat protein
VLVLLNPRHVHIRNLDITATDDGNGILVWVTEPGAVGVSIEGVSVTGGKNGIAIGSEIAGGLSNVTISHCAVSNALLQGIIFFGPQAPSYGLEQVRITHCEVQGTRGNPELTKDHSGSGIVLGSVNHGEISHCAARENGRFCQATQGPEGIFVYDCANVVISESVSSDNRTGGPADGGGFGIDVRCQNCRIENCTATGNDGAGVLLWSVPGKASAGAVVRGNRLSQNCQKTAWHGEITVASSISDVVVRDNLLDPRADRKAIVVGENAITKLQCDGNILADGAVAEPVEATMPFPN